MLESPSASLDLPLVLEVDGGARRRGTPAILMGQSSNDQQRYAIMRRAILLMRMQKCHLKHVARALHMESTRFFCYFFTKSWSRFLCILSPISYFALSVSLFSALHQSDGPWTNRGAFARCIARTSRLTSREGRLFLCRRFAFQSLNFLEGCLLNTACLCLILLYPPMLETCKVAFYIGGLKLCLRASGTMCLKWIRLHY